MEMSEAIVTALIMALASIVCQVLINRNNRAKRTTEEQEKAQKQAVAEAVQAQNLETRLTSIETKLDVHNGYAEKLGDIATSIAVIENDIKTLYKQGART